MTDYMLIGTFEVLYLCCDVHKRREHDSSLMRWSTSNSLLAFLFLCARSRFYPGLVRFATLARFRIPWVVQNGPHSPFRKVTCPIGSSFSPYPKSNLVTFYPGLVRFATLDPFRSAEWSAVSILQSNLPDRLILLSLSQK
jgi:hypothetical protein